jgi:hypothetical protein
MDLKIGGIYFFDRTRFYAGIGSKDMYLFNFRVLDYDDYIVILDVIYPSESDWSLNKKNKGMVWFGQLNKDFFDEEGIENGFSEFDDELRRYYCMGMGLLIRISRIKGLSWDNPIFDSYDSLSKFTSANMSSEWHNQKIDRNKIYLVSKKKGDGYSSPKLIESANNLNFSALEILWNVSILQRENYSKNFNGVGVFRAGSKNGIPVYCIDDYFGGNAYLKNYEEKGINTNV